MGSLLNSYTSFCVINVPYILSYYSFLFLPLTDLNVEAHANAISHVKHAQ
jgi:hypothetical protein